MEKRECEKEKNKIKKQLPNGISDFKTLIENNYYYVDKTPFIEEVGANVGKTLLFTRPRRFGKTLNMSMLKYFFDINGAKENKKIFKELKIETSTYFQEQGKYPVIFISMKDMKEKNWDELRDKLINLISELYDKYDFLREKLNERNRVIFDKIWYGEKGNIYSDSLKFLSKILYEYYGKKVVVLIDEYDTPLISAYKYGYYNEAMDFLSNFYSSILKDNSLLQVGVVTGIIRVGRAGIFSDLNNLNEHSILDKKYDEYFGFLESEVEEILKYYEVDSKIAEVHSWYNGYRFGEVKIYNPWSILKFLSKREFKSYWIDTSENFLIKDILKSADQGTFEKLNKLLFKTEIKEEITGTSSLREVLEARDLWELLLFSGYLTIDKRLEGDTYTIKIPNKEVKEFFKNSFIQISFGTNLIFRSLIEKLLANNILEFEKNLQNILLQYMSFHDVSNIEKVYHSFVLGLLINLEGRYYISSNKEAGLGRYDILIEPKNKNLRGFVLEFKVAPKENLLEEVAKEGLRQIEEKKYYVELEKKGVHNMVFLALAFYKKRVKILSCEY